MKVLLGLFLLMVCASTVQALETAFLVGDDGNHRVALYDRNLELVWEYSVQKPYTVLLLDNGHILATTGREVIEITGDKKEVWRFKRSKHEIFGAARIGDETVVGDCTAGEVLFVGKDRKIKRSFKTVSKAKGHSTMRTLTVTPEKTILVAHLGDHVVREYSDSGDLLNEFRVRGPAYRGERLATGNTLVGHKDGITEFDMDGQILRDVKPSDIPTIGLAFGTHAHRMPDGNTVMANWFGHGGSGKALFELDQDMKPVWSIPDGLVGSMTAFAPVSDQVVAQYKDAATPKPVGTVASLCEAIDDLAKTFPDRYPKKYKAAADAFRQIDALEKQAVAGDQAAAAKAAKLREQAEFIREEALLANPLLQDASLVYTTRRQYKPDHHNTATIFQLGEVNEHSYDPPGKIRMLDVKSGTVHTLVDAGETGIARDPELSWDASKIIFSMRKNRDDDYHLYEIKVDPSMEAGQVGSGLKQLTSLPGVSDIDPVYLPDGKIIFSSTREPKFCMCNKHIMANLFRMDGDGANIHQIGKSTLFEGHSSVMDDGRILYDRWEYVDRNFGDAQGLWVVNPDGTMHAIYYGNNTPSPGGVIDARQIPGSQNVIAIFGSCHDRPWGALAVLDRNKGVDGAAAVEHIWPASARELIGVGNFDTFKKVRPRYEDPYPLADSDTLAGAGTYFLCVRTLLGNDERTGIFLIDTFGNEVLVHEEQDGFGCFNPIPVQARKSPRTRPDLRDFENGNGRFYVQDVYEGTHMEGVKRGTVKYLRVVESPEKRSFNQGGAWGGQGVQFPAMNWHSFENKRILGVVPVEQDGSAYFEVPSDTFFYFQLLDKDGKMVQSMRSGTIIQSGEMQGCVGCHEDRIKTPPASAEGLQALKRAASPMGRGYGAGRMFNYLADAQPIFDKHCVKCHDFGKEGAAAINLAGDKGLAFNASYTELHRKKMITVAGGGQAETYPAKSWGSHASRLTEMLDGHGKTKLTPAEKRILYTWMDLNGVYYPFYDCAYPHNPAGRSPLTHAQLTRLGKLCGSDLLKLLNWHRNTGVQVSFERPELSPCLQSLEKGSAEYKEALSIIQEGAAALKKVPRGDMAGFVPAENGLQRTERYEQLRAVEDAFRESLRDGRKLYDADVSQLAD